MKKLIIAIAICVLVTGCANIDSIRTIGHARVDPISVKDQEKYNSDLEECAQLALNWYSNYQRQALIGAILGAGLGAGLGAATGSVWNSRAAQQGAGLGAAYGSVAGAGAAKNYTNEVMKNCLEHRGYMLLW